MENILEKREDSCSDARTYLSSDNPTMGENAERLGWRNIYKETFTHNLEVTIKAESRHTINSYGAERPNQKKKNFPSDCVNKPVRKTREAVIKSCTIDRQRTQEDT